MSVLLMDTTVANGFGPAAPVRGQNGRIGATGNFAGSAVTVQYSHSVEQDDWKVLGTIGAGPGADLLLDFSVERLRVGIGVHTGEARVYFNPDS